MSNPYIGEIRMFAGNFAPNGWAFCSGQTLNIAEYDALFNLIGTTYGGDGITTFALPDLRGRVPIHQGTLVAGESGGAEQVMLTTAQMPNHTHGVRSVSSAGRSRTPEASLPAGSGSASVYSTAAPDANFDSGAVTVSGTGSTQAHENMQPFLCVNFIISLFGIFPAQS